MQFKHNLVSDRIDVLREYDLAAFYTWLKLSDQCAPNGLLIDAALQQTWWSRAKILINDILPVNRKTALNSRALPKKYGIKVSS